RKTLANSAAYLKSWIDVLKSDVRMVVFAASQAQKAADHIQGARAAFLSRCRVIEFSSYGMAGEIAAYLDTIWHAEGGNGDTPDLARLAKESRNNVRDALMKLEIELMAV